jgi:hypothetical protein
MTLSFNRKKGKRRISSSIRVGSKVLRFLKFT